MATKKRKPPAKIPALDAKQVQANNAKKPAPKPAPVRRTAAPKPKPAAPKKKTTKTPQEWADYYGWALALLKSDKSLWKLFQDAIKGNWKPAKFVIELKRTAWYQKNSESARKTLALKHTDPEEWRRRVRSIYQEIQVLAGTMGIKTTWQNMWDMAEDAMMFGWTNAQIRKQLASYLTSKDGVYGGEAGEAEQQLRQYAHSMGINLDSGSLNGWLKGIVNGTRTLQDYKGWIQKQAMSAYPGLAKQIQGGMTVQEIADPYMQSMGRILEMNPGQLNVNDPTIRRALQGAGVSPDGKTGAAAGTGGTMPLWQFENELRKDPRWLQTNNARQGLNSTARGILKDFGLAN
jgi:hypothetical protein